tara:strand:+ start:170 stop:1069 length:900 start_codon:yes stop_codon:yes gene_type:complete
MKKPTKTSSFGSKGREGHDSSKFYDSKLYDNKTKSQIEYPKNIIKKSVLNKIYNSSSENMKELPDNSIDLMITSPPYNVGKDYDEDLSLEDYLKFIKNVMSEVYRTLVFGGRACLNITNVGRKPYIPYSAYFATLMIDLGFLMRGEIIWDKSASAGTSTAWGSWQSASNPTLRDVHEYILVFSKDSFSKNKKDKINTISKENFLINTKSIWKFPTASAKRIKHPAPFPLELPINCMELYSFENDIVLDPFIGSGQTAIAALKTNRQYVGYEISSDYCDLANTRINKYLSQSSLDEYNSK